MKKLVFLEFIDEYQSFCEYIGKQGLTHQAFTLVALEPKLQAYLKKNGINYENSLAYFNNDSHKAIILSAQKVIDHIALSFKYNDDSGVSGAYLTDLQFYVRFYLFHLMRLIEIIDNCVGQDGTVEMYAAVSEQRAASLMITPSDRYLGKLAEAYAANHSLKFTNIAGSQDTAVPAGGPKRPNKPARLMIGLIKLYCRLFGKKLILVPGNGYGFAALKAKLSDHIPGLAFISPCPEKLQRSPFSYLRRFASGVLHNHFWVELNGSEAAAGELRKKLAPVFQGTNAFEYKGVDLSSIIERRASIAIVPYFVELSGQIAALKEMLKDLGIKLIVSPFARGLWFAAGELSRSMGISSLFVSHGTHPVPIDAVHEMELVELCRGFMLSEYTDVALSTPIQEEHLRYFKEKYSWVKANELKTGPLIFADLKGQDKRSAKLKLGLLPEETIVTHAVTNKKRSGERFYFLETLDEYIASLSDLIRAVEKMTATRLIIRVHPGFELSDEELKLLLPRSDKFIINRHGPFADVLAATDVLVSYSSTALDEALLNERPVILFDKWSRYNHFRLPVYQGGRISQPVVYVNEGAWLGDAIGEFREKLENKAVFNYSDYKYDIDYEDNFYDYVRAALSGKGAL